MPLVEHHEQPRPESCEVCRYLQERPELHARLEHTLTRIAQVIMLTDLEESDQPLRMRSIYQESIGYPGPQMRIEPRHWLLGLLEAPEIRLLLHRGDTTDV